MRTGRALRLIPCASAFSSITRGAGRCPPGRPAATSTSITLPAAEARNGVPIFIASSTSSTRLLLPRRRARPRLALPRPASARRVIRPPARTWLGETRYTEKVDAPSALSTSILLVLQGAHRSDDAHLSTSTSTTSACASRENEFVDGSSRRPTPWHCCRGQLVGRLRPRYHRDSTGVHAGAATGCCASLTVPIAAPVCSPAAEACRPRAAAAACSRCCGFGLAARGQLGGVDGGRGSRCRCDPPGARRARARPRAGHGWW